MPPHAPDESPVPGLPVHHRVLRPGAVATGCVVVAAAALLAHAQSLGAGLAGGDRALLDGPHAAEGAFRPLAHASLAFDWFLSGSETGAPRAAWFHAVQWLLHAANAALVYLLLAGLTKRRLGAPLLAATLWAVHPLAVEPVTSVAARGDVLAAFLGFASAVLLLRSPGKPRFLAAAVVCYGAALFAKPSVATLPVVVALGLVAYHEVEPARLLSSRLRNRFVLFAAPLTVWFAARWIAAGSPFADGSASASASVLGAGRAFFVQTLHVLLPVRLSGSYAADPACTAGAAGVAPTGLLGWALLAALVAFGASRLRRHPFAFPALAYVVTLLPAGGTFADRALYLPSAFLLLGVAEGLEGLYYRWAGVRGLSVTLALFLLLPVLCHLRARVWRDDAAFWADVLVSYPGDHEARARLDEALARPADAPR